MQAKYKLQQSSECNFFGGYKWENTDERKLERDIHSMRQLHDPEKDF